MSGNTIKIDVTIRPATLDDSEGVADVYNACSMEDRGKPETSGEELRSDWQVPGYDLATDTRVIVTPDGRVIGYGDVYYKSSNFVRQISWIRVHPEYRGLGIGTYLNDWAEERAREVIDKAPEGAMMTFETAVPAVNTAARELLLNRGMSESRHSYEMEISLDKRPSEPEWPEGITVRTKRPDEWRAIYDADREAFRDHHGFVEEPPEEGFPKWKHWMENETHFDPSLWFVAEEGDRIAGFSISTPKTIDDPEMAWVVDLGVLRDWRRRGLGLALLLKSFGEFYARGIKRAGLGVDAESLTGATRLYVKAGMHVTHEHVWFEKVIREGKDLRTQTI